jgi:hypothetical protein
MVKNLISVTIRQIFPLEQLWLISYQINKNLPLKLGSSYN